MSERNFYFINLYSHDIDLKAYVLLCILVNKTTSTVDSYDAAVAMSPEHMEAPEYATYKDILNRIQKQ
ncbi:MAG: hypothetical protein KDK45_17180, partial [Leptospiraceae bacterium]|nr:hypothetical protein [Leptospiraceae bacterium]